MLEDARKDFLTGLFARDSLDQYAQHVIAESEKGKKEFCVVLLDLDQLKRLNDQFGHLFGDDVLKFVASVLQMTFFNNEGIFFRYGGDEFVGIFAGVDCKAAVNHMRLFIRNVLRRPFLFKNKFYKILLSCGVTCFPQDGRTFEELVAKADAAMCYSKRCGHNLVTAASHIRFLKIRRARILFGLIAVILSCLSFLYHWTLKSIIRPKMEQIKNMKIVSKPSDLDTVVLMDGTVFEGRIVSETPSIVVLELYFRKGEGRMVFKRSEIAGVKHGRKKME